MCGIVGLFIKDKALEPRLGAMLSDMLGTMCDRGPDSAGFAVYGAPRPGEAKVTVQSATPDADFAGLADALAEEICGKVSIAVKATHAVLTVPATAVDAARAAIAKLRPSVRIMGAGEAIEIYKEVGYPTDVSKRFALAAMA